MMRLLLAFADQDDDDLDNGRTLVFTPAELEQIRKLTVGDDDEGGTKTMMFMPVAPQPKPTAAPAPAPAPVPAPAPAPVAEDLSGTQFYMPSVQAQDYRAPATEAEDMSGSTVMYMPAVGAAPQPGPAEVRTQTTDTMPAIRPTQDRMQAPAHPAPAAATVPAPEPPQDLGSASTMLFSAADIKADLAKATARTTGQFKSNGAPAGGTLMFGAQGNPGLEQRLDEIESARTMVFSASSLGELNPIKDQAEVPPEPDSDGGGKTMMFGTKDVQAAVDDLRRQMGSEAEQGSQTMAFMPAQGKSKLDEAMELLRQNAAEATFREPSNPVPAKAEGTKATAKAAPETPKSTTSGPKYEGAPQTGARRTTELIIFIIIVAAAAVGAAAWFLDWL